MATARGLKQWGSRAGWTAVIFTFTTTLSMAQHRGQGGIALKGYESYREDVEIPEFNFGVISQRNTIIQNRICGWEIRTKVPWNSPTPLKVTIIKIHLWTTQRSWCCLYGLIDLSKTTATNNVNLKVYQLQPGFSSGPGATGRTEDINSLPF